MNLPIKVIHNVVQIENYDAFKEELTQALNEKYKLMLIQSSGDLAICKGLRAELNKLSENINDAKIQWVKDTTGLLVSQIKEICQIIDAKSDEYNKEIKTFTGVVDKIKYGTITINCYEKEEYDHAVRVLKRAKIGFKEKINVS